MTFAHDGQRGYRAEAQQQGPDGDLFETEPR
jgi:hypothetical protein